jgi:hypothetical protein
MKMILIIILSISHAASKEQWFCTDESGKRDKNVIWSCGVGEAPSESLARADALKEAMKEFRTICEASRDCSTEHVIVEPKRMTCLEMKDRWKCYRLIEVRLPLPHED